MTDIGSKTLAVVIGQLLHNEKSGYSLADIEGSLVTVVDQTTEQHFVVTVRPAFRIDDKPLPDVHE